MAARGGIILFNSSFIGSSVAQSQQWIGGRSALVINATQYGPGVIPQFQGLSGAWIPVCSAIVSDQYFPFDAPPGQYRLISNAGSSIGVVAGITAISYL